MNPWRIFTEWVSLPPPNKLPSSIQFNQCEMWIKSSQLSRRQSVSSSNCRQESDMRQLGNVGRLPINVGKSRCGCLSLRNRRLSLNGKVLRKFNQENELNLCDCSSPFSYIWFICEISFHFLSRSFLSLTALTFGWIWCQIEILQIVRVSSQKVISAELVGPDDDGRQFEFECNNESVYRVDVSSQSSRRRRLRWK